METIAATAILQHFATPRHFYSASLLVYSFSIADYSTGFHYFTRGAAMNKATFAAHVRAQFPFICDKEALDIARRSLQHADSVGHNESLTLDERVRCAVIAHIRHEYTTYEHDLQYMAKVLMYPAQIGP